MCRIAGIISNTLSANEIKEKVHIMCQALKHGGPDDEGVYYDSKQKLAFGHRRLSIIDLTNNGHQPMADIGNKAWISFNGEVYNYRELKQQLLTLGANFQSNTDTEVIIKAYLHWGSKSFSMLRGIFAFSLFDTERELTYLVRDTGGIKPLYYHIENNQLSFASEVKALTMAGIANQADPLWQIRFLAFGHVPEPCTTHKNVFSLPKGNFLRWHHATSTFNIESYNNKTSESYITDVDEAKYTICQALKASVKRQLVADAPIGVFLSGGIDSSLITLLANEHKHDLLKTISICFDEKAYDESAYQAIILNKIQGEKFTHLVKQQDFDDNFPQVMQAMDMPTTDGINSWFISKYAHQDGLKAVLSGIGGDELFGGYPSFNRIKYLQYLRKIPTSLLAAATYFTSEKYRKIAFISREHPLADYLLLRGLFNPSDIAYILDVDSKEINDALFSDHNFPDIRHYDEEQASWFEINLYMQNQLLRDTDVMSMNHGLEVRVPFLDEEFIRVVEKISPTIRFDAHHPKKILIDSFSELLPPSIWSRPKMGFTFPLQQWMNKHPEIGNEQFYHNKPSKSLIKRFKEGHMHWSKAFALFQIQSHV